MSGFGCCLPSATGYFIPTFVLRVAGPMGCCQGHWLARFVSNELVQTVTFPLTFVDVLLGHASKYARKVDNAGLTDCHHAPSPIQFGNQGWDNFWQDHGDPPSAQDFGEAERRHVRSSGTKAKCRIQHQVVK
eukprot:scaffold10757_cov57-Attheya_sp.AAC.6